MLFQDFLTWIKQEFGYPVPKDYLSFDQKVILYLHKEKIM